MSDDAMTATRFGLVIKHEIDKFVNWWWMQHDRDRDNYPKTLSAKELQERFKSWQTQSTQ